MSRRDMPLVFEEEADSLLVGSGRCHPGIATRKAFVSCRSLPRAACAGCVVLSAVCLSAVGAGQLRSLGGGRATPAHGLAEPSSVLEASSKPRTHFNVFGEVFPWRTRDLQDERPDETSDEPSYVGRSGMWCVGVNLLGYSLDASAGRVGQYIPPALHDVEYFYHEGANCFRLAITWERLQPKLGSEELDLVAGVDELVDYITEELEGHVILDPHNGQFGLQHNGVNVVRSDFAKLWTAIAKKWCHNDKVIFGLYNEPRGGFENGVEEYFTADAQDPEGEMVDFWRQWAQAAVDAIREAGAKNLILVPGLHRSNAAEWTGAGLWGEENTSFGEYAGNMRLAALHDPEKHLAYEVHQHMDPQFDGAKPGCSGHNTSAVCDGDPDCHGADWGLEQTVEWARKHNKKLMMTELGSLSDPTKPDENCRGSLHAYIERMNASGVFLGYQAWQTGCKDCLGEMTPHDPRNLDWYRLHDFGRPCSDEGEDCRSSRCCKQPGSKCYQKDKGWASCRAHCKPGIDKDEPKKLRTNWTCKEVAYEVPKCSDSDEDCSETKCCNDPSRQCYVKDENWAVCRRGCTAGEVWEQDDPDHRKPWNCTRLRLNTLTRIQLK